MSSSWRRTLADKVVAVIQARMGATRFPGKVLADIAGKPMLWHVVNRVRAADAVDAVVVATSSEASDDPIAEYCAAGGIACFRGSELDVLDRFHAAAKAQEAAVVVRITADCPLIDPSIVSDLVHLYRSGHYDYVTNTLRYTYPDGLDAEAFSFAALEDAWKSARLPAEREHVTPYIRSSGLFRIGNLENPNDLSSRQLRWTVDEPRDLEFVRAVYGLLAGKGMFKMADVLGVLDDPMLNAMEDGAIRNEGYYRSLAGEPPVAVTPRSLEKSMALKARASAIVPSCTQTFSKGPTQFVQGVAPVYLERGQGCRVWDVDGNEYIDYPMALGAIILGHNHREVTEAVAQQIKSGTTYTLPHRLEVELSELLVELIPCAEMVRFAKNGSDVTAGAIRAARAHTGREMVACCGYHGWQDWYIGTTTRRLGVPKAVQSLTRTFSYNDLASLEKIFAENPGRVGAVIMEPVGVVEPRAGFLEGVKELTHSHGAVLIFDEIITGFRLAFGGAQELYSVTPDLACFGKAMGNGFPIAAVVGSRDIMPIFDDVFFSFTFGGEVAGIAAALATIREMQTRKVIPHLWEQGQRLRDGYNVLAHSFGVSKFTECVGLPPRTAVVFRDDSGSESLLLKSLFQQECLKRGVLFGGPQNVCFAHGEREIDQTLRVYRTAMEILAAAIDRGDAATRLEGTPVEAVFRKL